MSYREFMRNTYPDSSNSRGAVSTLDAILTKIVKLAQSQSNGPIPEKVLVRKIRSIEKLIGRLPNYEVNGNHCLLTELQIIEKENLRNAV